MQFVKCTNCKGTGHVRKSYNSKLEKCPICKGTGKKLIHTPNYKRKSKED